jgi:hypothetical protein
MAALTVILPCYNEAGRLPSTLQALLDRLSSAPGEVEILVVDDGSTDATLAVAEDAAGGDPRVRVIRTGLTAARGSRSASACWPPPATASSSPTPTAPMGRTRSIAWPGRSPAHPWRSGRATRPRPASGWPAGSRAGSSTARRTGPARPALQGHPVRPQGLPARPRACGVRAGSAGRLRVRRRGAGTGEAARPGGRRGPVRAQERAGSKGAGARRWAAHARRALGGTP